MKIEDQVLSIEQAKHLQELGLDMSDAALCWEKGSDYIRIEKTATCHSCDVELIPTYTLQEVLDKLPKEIISDSKNYGILINYEFGGDYEVSYCRWGDVAEYFIENTLKEAAYNMLCWVIENGYLEEKK